MSKIKYKVTIQEFSGEGTSLRAQSLYDQTVTHLDIVSVIEAVNAPAALPIETPKLTTPVRKRAPRSDRGKPRTKPLYIQPDEGGSTTGEPAAA